MADGDELVELLARIVRELLRREDARRRTLTVIEGGKGRRVA